MNSEEYHRVFLDSTGTLTSNRVFMNNTKLTTSALTVVNGFSE